MAITFRERIDKGLELLTDGLASFVEQELESVYHDIWIDKAKGHFYKDKEGVKIVDGKPQWDIHGILIVIWNEWHEVFGKTLGHAERSIVSELREVRNRWAHRETFSSDDAYRALDSMERLLKAVSATQSREMEQMKQEVLRQKFREQERTERRKQSDVTLKTNPEASLKAWREVVTPHKDVITGNYQTSEFALDLSQVHRGEAVTEYQDPEEFFRRTYLTEGISSLLKNAIKRLSGNSGDPVVELQTNFGGGKTHSLLSLYHLFSGVEAQKLSGMEPILQTMNVNSIPKVNRAVLVGTALSPAHKDKKKDGTVVHTLWGEMAYQLGGKKAYKLVEESDVAGVSPGSDILTDLFKKYGPCLVMIDEWVAYARQLYEKQNMPGGSFDAMFTFAQALTEAAKAVPNVLILASIPSSDIEIGGSAGKQALSRLQHVFSRVEASWRPASAEEGFEIVRRRLFQEFDDPKHYAERDNVISQFNRFYQSNKQDFPSEVHEAEYRRRMEAAYPFHPELFDRLYNDWGSLDKFQRTRGVLRLMAKVIQILWDNSDSSPLIMPASIPINDVDIQEELTRYLEDNWTPIIEKDVDGDSALPRKLDNENPSLGRYSTCRRVARTIYMGSAPKYKSGQQGLDEKSIKLGCVLPGESVATFGDALRRLTDQATHLYVDKQRYWYSTQPSVNRLAQDRANQFDQDFIWEELKKRLRNLHDRAPFSKVHLVPDNTSDIPEDMDCRLVLFGPEHSHTRKAENSKAMTFSNEILNQRGNSPRIYKNSLIFLAPDQTRLADLEQAVRQYLAWDSILSDKDNLDLTTFSINQSTTKKDESDNTINNRIYETYIWLLVPKQDNPQNKIEIEEIRSNGSEAIIKRSGKKLIHECMMYEVLGPAILRMELDKLLWKDADHISVKQLWEYFATYIYLPRLQSSQVIMNSIEEGASALTWDENFAYADMWDVEEKKYKNLVAGQHKSVALDGNSVLVKPEIARKQMEQEQSGTSTVQPGVQDGVVTPPSPKPGEGTSSGDENTPVSPTLPKRFFGTVELDSMKMGREAGAIANEVITHLAGQLGSKVQITMEIHATLKDGADEQLVRTVTENCRTLKFTDYGFESE